MRLVQFETLDGDRMVGVSDQAENYLQIINGVGRIYELAKEATDALRIVNIYCSNSRLLSNCKVWGTICAV